METIKQIFGRAIRADSHEQLSIDEKYTKQYIHVHIYNEHDLKIKFNLEYFDDIRKSFFNIDEEDQIKLPTNPEILNLHVKVKKIFDPNNIILDANKDININDIRKFIDPDNLLNNKNDNNIDTIILNINKKKIIPQYIINKIKDVKKNSDVLDILNKYKIMSDMILNIFDIFVYYDYVYYKTIMDMNDEDINIKEYKQNINKIIVNEKKYNVNKRRIYKELISDYNNYIFYPFDLYSYLRAFQKYIYNNKILDIFYKISLDCNLNKDFHDNIDTCLPKIDKFDVNTLTYKHEHNISKLEYITGAIKKLFETKRFYTYDDLINNFINCKINNKKIDNCHNYPIYINDNNELEELINLALLELTPSDNTDISIFKHKVENNGNIGYIIKKGNVILFQNAIEDEIDNYKRYLKEEKYITDIFTSIQCHKLNKNIKYQTFNDFFKNIKIDNSDSDSDSDLLNKDNIVDNVTSDSDNLDMDINIDDINLSEDSSGDN